ncbi:LysR family transcriptional regulator [Marinicella rhabdoformis]|uniref:LysR family transcriptional regulator n=1 Tax=Marinicella rhabdoformis TaxID=2580566 RepID=UPI0012AED6F9|nr:LysR family transcriptional regulator [Marinicella rhabdoformis]
MNTLENMQTFVRIIEAGSISSAADQLDVAKSVVSKRLQQLEQHMGVTLLTRTTRRQTLTAAGESYYQQCLRILEDVAEAEALVKDEHQALSGRIRMAVPLSFGLSHLTEGIWQFNQQHPDVVFDIDFSDRLVNLVEEGFDMGIRIAKLSESTLKARKLTSTKIVLCASPGYLAAHPVIERPEDLRKGHEFVQYSGGPDSWQFADADGKPWQLKMPHSIRANNGEFNCQSAIRGQGLIFLPDFICYKALRTGELVPVLEGQLPERVLGCYALYPETKHLTYRVRCLIDFLVTYFETDCPWQS